MPKRKIDEVDSEGEEQGGESAGSEDSNSSVQTSSSTDVPSTETASTSAGFTRVHRDKSVKFKGVTVFYFQRKQGFVCVPSQGGSTLGMCESHDMADNFSIREFARHQRRLHLDILAQQQGTKLPGGSLKDGRRSPGGEQSATSSNADSDSSSSSEDEDLNVDDYYFLQPVPTRQRRLLLRQAGIKKIDTLEKEECRDIRTSRESCGCDCRVYCEPETCACSLAGIKCQVDRLSFPCGCSKDGCGNQAGRIEFNPIRVRTHFIHTLMRLEMDRKQEEEAALREQRLKEHGPSRAESSPVCPELVTDPDPPPAPSAQGAEEDVTMFNSNERGSCCDCQNSDIHEFMMQESQFNPNVNTPTVNMTVTPSVNTPSVNTQGVNPPAVNNPSPATIQNTNSNNGGEYLMETVGQGVEASSGSKTGETGPQVLLFNDSDDDYSAETSATMYPFNKEDSSYSESSDCSSEASVSENDQNHVAPGGIFPGFPESAGYEMSSAVLDPAAGGGFCLQPAVLQQDAGKLLDLSEPGAAYKLEPISELLNPVRFPGYGSPGASWCGEGYVAGYGCGEQGTGQVGPTPAFCDTELPKAREYQYSGETDATSSTDSLSPSTQLPEQYLDQGYDGTSYPSSQPLSSQLLPPAHTSHTNGIQDTTEIHSKAGLDRADKSYHDLSQSTAEPDTISILPLPGSPQKCRTLPVLSSLSQFTAEPDTVSILPLTGSPQKCRTLPVLSSLSQSTAEPDTVSILPLPGSPQKCRTLPVLSSLSQSTAEPDTISILPLPGSPQKCRTLPVLSSLSQSTAEPDTVSILPLSGSTQKCKTLPMLSSPRRHQSSLTVLEMEKNGHDSLSLTADSVTTSAKELTPPQAGPVNMDLHNYDDVSQLCAPKKLCVAENGLIPAGHTLPQRPAMHALESQLNEAAHKVPTSAKCNGANGHADPARDNTNNEPRTQNFGEMIKESIVETVSA